jgi:hypothetical protein
MAETKTPLSAQTQYETIDYKPLSVPAVLGLVSGGLFILLALVLFILALRQGDPFFLSPWFFGLPIAGVVLSALGLWQVAGSEGTRAGAKAARWGLGVSLVGGIGYFTYVTFTGLAICQQANRFMTDREDNSGFLPRIIGSELDLRTAFLMTRSESEKSGIKPQNLADMERADMPVGSNPRGLFTLFCDSQFVKALRNSDPKAVSWEPLGVQDWTFESGAYKIRRSYRFHTDELTFDLPFVFTSSEPVGEGDKRSWKVEPMRFNLQILKRTPLGLKKQALRLKASEFVSDFKGGWLTHFSNRRLFNAYLATQPPAERRALEEKYKTIRQLTPFVALAGPTAAPTLSAESVEALATKWLPEYKPAHKVIDYFDISSVRFFDPRFQPYMQEILKRAIALDKAPQLQFKAAPDEFLPCEFKGGQAFITVPFEITITAPGPQGAVGELLFLGRVVTAVPENVNLNAPDVDTHFRVAHADFNRVLLVPAKKSQGGAP